MKRERAFELADALESGKYRQTNNVLARKDGSFCCLGVACVLAGKVFSEVPGQSRSADYLWADAENTSLPSDVIEYFGFFDETGSSRGDVAARSLASMNDDGASFEEIAAYIRRNWEDL